MDTAHVEDRHSGREKPHDQHDGVAQFTVGEHQRPVEPYHQDDERSI